MSKNIKLIALLASVLALASCGQKASYTTSPFVAFKDGGAISVNENVGTIKIPVSAYSYNGDLAFPRAAANTTVSIALVDGTEKGAAKNGVNYKLVSPADGELVIEGANEGFIEIEIINLEGEFTSNLKFSVELTGATDGYTVSGAREMEVTIKDLDHPLAPILGTYVASNIIDRFGDTVTIKTVVEPVEGSITKVTMTDLCPTVFSFGSPQKYEGEVDSEMTTITLKTPQVIDEDYGLMLISGKISGSNVSFLDKLEFTFDKEAQTLTNLQEIGAYIEGGGFADLYPSVVFVKQ